jgi:hypothetical protein
VSCLVRTPAHQSQDKARRASGCRGAVPPAERSLAGPDAEEWEARLERAADSNTVAWRQQPRQHGEHTIRHVEPPMGRSRGVGRPRSPSAWIHSRILHTNLPRWSSPRVPPRRSRENSSAALDLKRVHPHVTHDPRENQMGPCSSSAVGSARRNEVGRRTTPTACHPRVRTDLALSCGGLRAWSGLPPFLARVAARRAARRRACAFSAARTTDEGRLHTATRTRHRRSDATCTYDVTASQQRSDSSPGSSTCWAPGSAASGTQRPKRAQLTSSWSGGESEARRQSDWTACRRWSLVPPTSVPSSRFEQTLNWLNRSFHMSGRGHPLTRAVDSGRMLWLQRIVLQIPPPYTSARPPSTSGWMSGSREPQWKQSQGGSTTMAA